MKKIEKLYEAFGELIYVVAMADGVIQKEEVEAVKLVSMEAFKDILKHIGSDNHFVASNKLYYEFVVNAIEEKLNSSL